MAQPVALGATSRLARMTPSSFAGSRVMVVDDEPMVRDVVSAYLQRDGFTVSTFDDGCEALRHFRSDVADLMILDVMLPGLDGLAVLSEVRELGETPVILLSALADEADRVIGLEMGADDYVVKPFSPRELTTRVRTVLRRLDASVVAHDRLEFGAVQIEPRLREVRVNERVVSLTPKEFDLLVFLSSSPRQVFSRGQLLQHVWESSTEWQDPATVTVHMRRLREKIEEDPKSPRHLSTVWGVGYRFDP